MKNTSVMTNLKPTGNVVNMWLLDHDLHRERVILLLSVSNPYKHLINLWLLVNTLFFCLMLCIFLGLYCEVWVSALLEDKQPRIKTHCCSEKHDFMLVLLCCVTLITLILSLMMHFINLHHAPAHKLNSTIALVQFTTQYSPTTAQLFMIRFTLRYIAFVDTALSKAVICYIWTWEEIFSFSILLFPSSMSH